MAKVKVKSAGGEGKSSGSGSSKSGGTKNKYWKVELADSKNGAVIKIESKSDAKEKFLDLFGITGTDKRVTAEAVEFKHDIPVREFGKNHTEADCKFRGEGIIDYFHAGTDNRVDKSADVEEDDAEDDADDDA